LKNCAVSTTIPVILQARPSACRPGRRERRGTMDQKIIGQKIHELRSKMGLTIITLAKKVRLSQAQVSRLENGLQGFRSATLIKFAKALGVPPIYFFVEGEDTSTRKVAETLEKFGLTPSKDLRRTLSNPAFLKFAENCAKSFQTSKKNLLKMEAVLKHAEENGASNEATAELLRIPGILDDVRKAHREIAAGKGVNWRKVRRDV